MPVSSKPDSKLSSGLKKAASDTTNKNLSHVPCKFFKQGACQAGKSCPFSHTMDAQEQSPCKYFAKGNCKFGSKCALAHILPDGKRVATSGTGGKRKHRDKFANQGQAQGQTTGNHGQSQSQGQAQNQSQSQSQIQGQDQSQTLSQSQSQSQSQNTPSHYPQSFVPRPMDFSDKKSPGQIPVFQPSAMYASFNGSVQTSTQNSVHAHGPGGLGSPTNESGFSAIFRMPGSAATPSTTATTSRLTGSSSSNGGGPGAIGISSPAAASPIGSGRSLYTVFGSPYNQNSSFSQDGGRFSLAASPPSRSLSMSIWNEPQRNGRSPIQSQSQSFTQTQSLSHGLSQSQSFSQSSQFHSYSMHTQTQGLGFTHGHSHLLNGSAILDDDSDIEAEDPDFDLVPSSLNELLTPSERMRRSSSHAASQMQSLTGSHAIPSANGSGSASLIDPIGTPTNSTPLKSTPLSNKMGFNMFNSPPGTLSFASLASTGLNQSSKPSPSLAQTTTFNTTSASSNTATSSSSSALFDDDTQFLMDEVYKK